MAERLSADQLTVPDRIALIADFIVDDVGVRYSAGPWARSDEWYGRLDLYPVRNKQANADGFSEMYRVFGIAAGLDVRVLAVYDIKTPGLSMRARWNHVANVVTDAASGLSYIVDLGIDSGSGDITSVTRHWHNRLDELTGQLSGLPAIQNSDANEVRYISYIVSNGFRFDRVYEEINGTYFRRGETPGFRHNPALPNVIDPAKANLFRNLQVDKVTSHELNQRYGVMEPRKDHGSTRIAR